MCNSGYCHDFAAGDNYPSGRILCNLATVSFFAKIQIFLDNLQCEIGLIKYTVLILIRKHRFCMKASTNVLRTTHEKGLTVSQAASSLGKRNGVWLRVVIF